MLYPAELRPHKSEMISHISSDTQRIIHYIVYNICVLSKNILFFLQKTVIWNDIVCSVFGQNMIAAATFVMLFGTSHRYVRFFYSVSELSYVSSSSLAESSINSIASYPKLV